MLHFLHLLSLLASLSPILLDSASAAPFESDLTGAGTASASLEKRYTTLGDGTSFQSGSISSTLKWQASGILSIGGCNSKYQISTCYQSYLASSGMLESTTSSSASTNSRRSLASNVTDSEYFATQSELEDAAIHSDYDLAAYELAFPSQYSKRQVTSNCGGSGGGGGGTPAPPSPRQRNEIYSWPGAAAGTTWKFTWKTYLVGGVSTSQRFFHLFQILRRDSCGGPTITLDAKAGLIVLGDIVLNKANVASVPIASWTDKTILHSLTVKFGVSGSIIYTANQVGVRKVLLSYQSSNRDTGANASLKFGSYRDVVAGMTDTRSFMGDYTATQLS